MKAITLADAIGVARRWIQATGTPREHLDVCRSKRALAVRYGAVEVTGRELARIIKRRTLARPAV